MDCVVQGHKYILEFEVMNARQLSLVSGSVSEKMGLYASPFQKSLE